MTCRGRQKETSKKQLSATSKISAVSFPLRDVIISMEPTSQPEGVRFTIEQKADANYKYPLAVVAGRIMTTENGTTLCLDWSAGATVLAMGADTEQHGFVRLAIAQPTSK